MILPRSWKKLKFGIVTYLLAYGLHIYDIVTQLFADLH